MSKIFDIANIEVGRSLQGRRAACWRDRQNVLKSQEFRFDAAQKWLSVPVGNLKQSRLTALDLAIA